MRDSSQDAAGSQGACPKCSGYVEFDASDKLRCLNCGWWSPAPLAHTHAPWLLDGLPKDYDRRRCDACGRSLHGRANNAKFCMDCTMSRTRRSTTLARQRQRES